MEMSTIIAIGVITIILLIVIGTRYLFQYQPQCLYCESTNIVQMDRRILATRPVDFNGGDVKQGGRDIRLQIDPEITFRCHNCNKTFNKKVTKTH